VIKYILTLIPVSCIWKLHHSQYRLQKLSHSKYSLFNWSFIKLDQGWGTYLLSRSAWILHYRWRAAKSINFILKFSLFLTTKSALFWLTIQVPAYHGASFQRDLYSKLGNENSDEDHIKCPRWPQVPHSLIILGNGLGEFARTRRNVRQVY